MTQPAATDAAPTLTLFPADAVLLGASDVPQILPLAYANRHGLIAGATGTGKTITLQVMAEAFSNAGVPVFMADVKGDLSGIGAPAQPNPKIQQRVETLGIGDYAPQAAPVIFWDVFGERGHPLRTTISEMGPLLLARILELTDAQAGVLQIAFAAADAQGLLLLDLKDLHAMLGAMEESPDAFKEYGHVAKASVGAIRRALLTLEQQGGKAFFGEPALNIADLLRTDRQGRGYVHLLAAEKLIGSPLLYATFLLWLLAELYETLPEMGDLDKPRLVFFFDEAHLLFDEAPKALLSKVEQVVRLIRSKGVGVYFVTQNPRDIPADVLGQLGNRVQHALRAFTPDDQKAVKAAAQSFRANPAFKTEEAIMQLGVGEALVSTLSPPSGAPSVVARALIRPPASRIGPLDEQARRMLMQSSPLFGQYEQAIDRESAYELLQKRAQPQPQAAPERADAPRPRASNRQGYGEAMVKSVVRSVGSSVGRQIANQLVRGILGSLMK